MSRRRVLQVGSLGLSGISLPALLARRAAGAPAPRTRTTSSFGRARSCILLYLTGGPPQHETWDPKPEASAEIRGAFGALRTRVDGLQAGELMPRLAALAHHCAVIRTVATDVNAHTGSGYWMLTGHPHKNRSGESTPPDPSDWPCLGAVVQSVTPRDRTLPGVVTLPEAIKNNPGIVVAGQTPGFMGREHEPFLVECDPHLPGAQIPGLTPLPGLQTVRLERRRRLLDSVNHVLDRAAAGTEAVGDRWTEKAFDLLTADSARRAFALDEEPDAARARYGMHKFGQSCLLARRLVEAGVRLVTVHWPREPNDFSIGNPVWDTHSDHNRRLKENLMPPMDQGVSALIEDLQARGLLDETLVVWMGEFGRTPKFNPNGGRDHWGHVFPVMLCGGGILPGALLGESDRIGAYPESDRVEPAQIHATIHHCLGIPPGVQVYDALGRGFPACEAEPISRVLA